MKVLDMDSIAELLASLRSIDMAVDSVGVSGSRSGDEEALRPQPRKETESLPSTGLLGLGDDGADENCFNFRPSWRLAAFGMVCFSAKMLSVSAPTRATFLAQIATSFF